MIAKTKELSLVKSIAVSSTFHVILFGLLTAVAAQVSIPIKPVPFTLQTMMVMLAGAMLGSRKGAYSQILYLIMGVSGLPVFAGASFGIATIFGPTGGYLLAFPAAAFITGYIIEKKNNYFVTAAAMFLGNALIIISGSAYLYAFWVRDLKEAITAGAVIFSVWTVIKVIAGTAIYSALSRNK
jgi:biotin transport system substrate-specific component